MGVNLILGGIFFLLGTLLLYFSAVQRARRERFRAVRTCTPREIAEAPPPPGTLVEVRGTIACDTPITAALSRQACVFFASSIRERIEEISWQPNRRTGLVERQVRTFHRSLEERTDRVPFWLVDQGHRVLVDPHGAEIEGKPSVDRFHPADLPPRLPGHDPARLTVPGGTVSGDSPSPGSPGPAVRPPEQRVLGAQQSETLLPLGAAIGVIGTLQERQGRLVLAKPAPAGSLFLITGRTLEDLAGAAEKAMRFWLIGGGVSCLLGFFIFLLGFR